MTPEAVKGPENTQKDLLRQVERLVTVTQQVQGELNDHALVLRDEVSACDIIASHTPLHEGRFAAADCRPTDDTSMFH